jgi:hypothetical protein
MRYDGLLVWLLSFILLWSVDGGGFMLTRATLRSKYSENLDRAFGDN